MTLVYKLNVDLVERNHTENHLGNISYRSNVVNCSTVVVRARARSGQITLTTRTINGGFTLGPGGYKPQIVARPPSLAVLLTHCGQIILRKISKFDATIDVRF